MADILLKRSWSEIIFDKKNKLYGAFYLRMLYTKNVGLALLIAGSIFSLAIVGGFLYYKSLLEKDDEYVIHDAPKVKVLDTPPVEKKKDVTPPPPEPPKVEIKEYNNYAPKEDELVKTVLNKVDSVLNSNAGSTNQDGIKDPSGPITFEEVKEEQPIQIEEDVTFNLEDVDEQPSFPGGYPSMNEFFAKNVDYPSSAKKMGISGKVFIMFTVDSEGNLSNFTVARKVDDLLDKEALRVAKMMPKWIPGKSNGRSVKTGKVTIPFNFQLGE